jgi:hypothetical protein
MKRVAVVIACVVTLLAVAHTGAVTLDTVDMTPDPLATVGSTGTLTYIHDVDLAATGSSSSAVAVSEPSGLLALALVMVTLGVGVVMRLARDLRALVSQCAQYRIELDGLRRWWTTHRRHVR